MLVQKEAILSQRMFSFALCDVIHTPKSGLKSLVDLFQYTHNVLEKQKTNGFGSRSTTLHILGLVSPVVHPLNNLAFQTVDTKDTSICTLCRASWHWSSCNVSLV